MSFESYNPPLKSRRKEYLPGGKFDWSDIKLDNQIPHICKNCGWAYGFHIGDTCDIPKYKDDLDDKRSDIEIYRSYLRLKTNIRIL